MDESIRLIEQLVHSSLDIAVDNGYDMTTWSVEAIVEDILRYDSFLEDREPDDIRPHVISWLAKRK